MAPSDPASELQDDDLQTDDLQTDDVQAEATEEEKKPLSLEVKVEETGTCERHVTVTIPREDIDRYLDVAYSELLPKAEVAGFRPGKAPRKLVESRFRDQIKDQVKGSLLLDSMSQVADTQEFSAISEPNFDYNAVTLPNEGPMTFEFDIEVRPEFEMPDWKGLSLKRLAHEYSEDEVTERTKLLLARYGQLAPYGGEAEEGDHLVLNVVFRHEGNLLSKLEEETVPLRKVLSFRDATLDGFDQLMLGVKEGETRTGKVKVSDEVESEALRGQEVDAEFEVLEVKRTELPDMTPEFLDRFGFENEDDLRAAVREELERQLSYKRDQSLREQVSSRLLAQANWDLPPDMLRRQSRRELERAVMELQSAGFGKEDIQRYANQLQQSSLASTKRALKEHFIFERIAEEHEIEPTPEDYEDEVARIAEATDDSPRRVRARLEKRGQMDALRNQIVERKVLELIQAEADVTDVPFESERNETSAVDYAVVGGKSDAAIPEAKYAQDAESLKPGTDRG